MNSRDKALLDHRQFDEGFHADLAQPASIGEALQSCIDQALAAKRALCLQNGLPAGGQSPAHEDAGE